MSTPNYSLATPEEIEEFSGMPTPNAAEARWILRPLGWDERLDCIDANASVGNSVMRFYSLEEAARYFSVGCGGTGFVTGTDGSICCTTRDDIISWARQRLGDAPLASALEARWPADETRPYHELVREISRLLNMRVAQAKGALAEAAA